jgi:hypothetical protein
VSLTSQRLAGATMLNLEVREGRADRQLHPRSGWSRFGFKTLVETPSSLSHRVGENWPWDSSPSSATQTGLHFELKLGSGRTSSLVPLVPAALFKYSMETSVEGRVAIGLHPGRASRCTCMRARLCTHVCRYTLLTCSVMIWSRSEASAVNRLRAGLRDRLRSAGSKK